MILNGTCTFDNDDICGFVDINFKTSKVDKIWHVVTENTSSGLSK